MPPSLSDTADRLAHASGLEPIVGRPSTIWRHQKLQRRLPDLATAVTALGNRMGDEDVPRDQPAVARQTAAGIQSCGWPTSSLNQPYRLEIFAGTLVA